MLWFKNKNNNVMKIFFYFFLIRIIICVSFLLLVLLLSTVYVLLAIDVAWNISVGQYIFLLWQMWWSTSIPANRCSTVQTFFCCGVPISHERTFTHVAAGYKRSPPAVAIKKWAHGCQLNDGISRRFVIHVNALLLSCPPAPGWPLECDHTRIRTRSMNINEFA